MAVFEQIRVNVGKLLLQSIDRYNPENLSTLELYVKARARKNKTVTAQILLEALTKPTHTDFMLYKCMID
ncbi:hypothetical protein AB205_0177700, partial [Aquarana catesbeiana]